MSESKLVGVNVSEAQAAFVSKAAEAFIAAGHGKTKADFIRSALSRACSAQLGEDFPPDEVLSGPKDAIAIAAEKAGMTRAQFTKYASLVAAGVEPTVAHAKALTPHPLSKAEKAKRAAEAAAVSA
jgi:hypothetical protein